MAIFFKIKFSRRVIFGVLALAIIGFIAFLEIGSRIIYCDTPRFICDGGLYGFLPPVTPSEVIAIREKRAAGTAVSPQEYRAAFEKLVKETDPSMMAGNNGYACTDAAYVRNDLPKEAMLHVKRHELEHLISPQASEFQVNAVAFKEYPVGGVETIAFTVKNSAAVSPQKPCVIFNFWRSFKRYFLPFSELP